MLSWLRSLGSARRAASVRPGTTPFRSSLTLESLDGRSVPSATPVSEAGDLARVLIERLDHTRGDLLLAPPVVPPAALAVLAPPTEGAIQAVLAAEGPELGLQTPPAAEGAGPELPPPPGVALILDQLRREPPDVAVNWLETALARRAAPDFLPAAPASESVAAGGLPARVPHAPHDIAREADGRIPVAVAKVVDGSPVEHWSEVVSPTVWFVLRNPAGGGLDAAVAAADAASAAAEEVPPAARAVPKSTDADPPLFPEAAGFLSPIFPFDTAGLQEQVAQLRDLLQPVVPLLGEPFAPADWLAGATVVGAGVGGVIWYRRSSARGRALIPARSPPTGKVRQRPDEDEDSATVRLLPWWQGLSVAEVGVEG